MAAPTFAEAVAKLKAKAKILNEIKKFAGTNSPNLVDLLRTYEETDKADGSVPRTPFASTIKAAVAALLKNPGATLAAELGDMARSAQVASRATSPQDQIDAIVRYMIGASQSVKTRAFTSGAFSSGSPYVGNGTIERVTKDENGLDLEARFADVYTLRVEQDAQAGGSIQKGRESWRIEGKPYVDEAEWGLSGRGSGLSMPVNAVNADDSRLRNPNFSEIPTGGDATPTAIPGWTSATAIAGDGSDYVVDRTNYYQESKGDNGSPASLQIKATRTLSQKLSVRGISVDPRVPYYCAVKLNAQIGTATGDLQLVMGTKSKTVTVDGLTGWQEIKLPASNVSDLWFKNWNETDAAIKLVWTRTGGTIRVTRVMFLPYVPVLNRAGRPAWFVLPVSGATPWLYRDTGTITDSETGAIVQDWFDRAWGRYLPHDASPTIADP